MPVVSTIGRYAVLIAPLLLSIPLALRADIPWPEVVQRLAYENEKLARRPQGHNGEYFVVCTLYYTPKESGFTSMRRQLQSPDWVGESIPAIFFAQ